MKLFFAVIFFSFCCLIPCAAQNEIVINLENKDPGYILYVGNSAFCPITISFEFNLDNLKFTNARQKTFVIPAQTQRFKIGELDVIDLKEKYKYSYRYNYNYGDDNLRNYDSVYEYSLPYQKGRQFLVWQGYFGTFSHQNENALDFTMPEGTEISAARDGVIIKVVQNNTESCGEERCKQFNNYITVYHADGTFADYIHIKYNGSKVKVGDKVKSGDLIAYSGNTGWSSGPHLHFVCYLQGLGQRRTLKTKFKFGNGGNAGYLEEKETYFKN